MCTTLFLFSLPPRKKRTKSQRIGKKVTACDSPLKLYKNYTLSFQSDQIKNIKKIKKKILNVSKDMHRTFSFSVIKLEILLSVYYTNTYY